MASGFWTGDIMINRSFRVALVAAVLLVLPCLAHAQQPLQDRWPTQSDQKQMDQNPPASAPAAPAKNAAAPEKKPVASAPTSKRAAAASSPIATVIACGGLFGKDSSHLKLAQTFEAQNIAYTEVDGPGGTKIMASVIYPKDPKRRLEVLWDNEATRSDLSVISINGQSTWVAPKGIKLGMPIVALEKLNGKPFKLAGFDWDDGGSVRDWMGGALASLPGGCAVGLKLAPDPKTSGDLRSRVSGDKDFLSSDPLIRAANPTIEEITIGYTQ
jgi:hypothetical protein